MAAAASQLTLSPSSPPRGEPCMIPLEQIKPVVALAPTPQFLSSVRSVGVLQPVILARTLDGPYGYELLAGRRRYAAAMKVMQENPDAGRTKVPAYVLQLDGWASGAAVVSAIENELRGANSMDTLQVLEALAAQGFTATQIASELGISPQRQRRIWRLHELIPELREAIADNRMSTAAGEKAARLSHTDQRALAAAASGKRITGHMVAASRQVRRDDALRSLFADLDAHAPMPAAATSVDAAAALAQIEAIVAGWGEEPPRRPRADCFRIMRILRGEPVDGNAVEAREVS